MGDFDKNQKNDKSAEKKKLLVVVVLGGVLLSIGAVHFLKGSPQTASAAIAPAADGAAGAITTDETPAQATAALQVDPTAKLLRGSQNADSLLDTIPRNPFKITPTWESTLVKAVEPVAPGEPQVVHTTQPIGAPKLVETSSLKLTGIFRQDQKLFAIINGDIYTVGMLIDNARILDISSTTVTLQRSESITAPKAFLTIEKKLK